VPDDVDEDTPVQELRKTPFCLVKASSVPAIPRTIQMTVNILMVSRSVNVCGLMTECQRGGKVSPRAVESPLSHRRLLSTHDHLRADIVVDAFDSFAYLHSFGHYSSLCVLFTSSVELLFALLRIDSLDLDSMCSSYSHSKLFGISSHLDTIFSSREIFKEIGARA
jgi:hypothetical protein